MKQLGSFMSMNVDGGERLSYTYNEVDEESGEYISTNNKKSFIAVDPELIGHIEAIREHIIKNKLSD